MALADPQSVTINAVANPLPRVSFGASEGIFRNADNTTVLRVSHAQGTKGRQRHLVRLEQTKIAADPLTSVNSEVTLTAHVVIDVPRSGFSSVEQKQLVEALCGYLTASASAKTVQILGGES